MANSTQVNFEEVSSCNSWDYQEELRKIPFGLYNIGNTCYLNAAVQAICRSDKYMKFLETELPSDNCENNILATELLFEVYESIWKEKSLHPITYLRNYFCTRCTSFANNRQHDSCEFLLHLLNLIKNEMIEKYRPRDNKNEKIKNTNQMTTEENIISSNGLDVSDNKPIQKIENEHNYKNDISRIENDNYSKEKPKILKTEKNEQVIEVKGLLHNSQNSNVDNTKSNETYDNERNGVQTKADAAIDNKSNIKDQINTHHEKNKLQKHENPQYSLIPTIQLNEQVNQNQNLNTFDNKEINNFKDVDNAEIRNLNKDYDNYLTIGEKKIDEIKNLYKFQVLYFTKNINTTIDELIKQNMHVFENNINLPEVFIIQIGRHSFKKLFSISNEYTNIKLQEILALKCTEVKQNYELISIVEHMESIFCGGHYVSYVKDRTDENVWWWINDSTVKKIEFPDCCQAYLLVYQKTNKNIKEKAQKKSTICLKEMRRFLVNSISN